MAERDEMLGQALTLRGNGELDLGEPSTLWTVDSGSLALFAVAGDRGGRRSYLFTCGPGEALFGLPTVAGLPSVVAVALEPTRLTTWPRDVLSNPSATVGLRSTELIRRWAGHWGEALGQPQEGPGDGENLAAWHERALARLVSRLADDQREAVHRFFEREQQSRQGTDEAITELTRMFGRGRTDVLQGPDLFVAAQAVALVSSITLSRPTRRRGGLEAMDPVMRLAAASRVRVRRVLLHDGWWREECGPLLAFVAADRRPVGLLPRSGGGYDVFDPATRIRTPVDEALASRLDARAHQFYRPLPHEPTSGLALIRFALTGRARDLLVLLVTGAAATLLGMFTPQATALLVDRAIPDADRGLLTQLGLGLVAAAFGAALFRLSQGIALTRIETSADTVTQSAVWDRLLNLQLSFFRRFSVGDLASRVTAISQIRSYLSGTTLRTLFSSVILLMNLALLVYYSPGLTLVALVVAALSAAVTIGSGALILRCYREILEFKGKFFGLLVQLINGVAKLRVAAAEDRAFARWAGAYTRLLRLELRQRTIQDVVATANVGLSSFSAVALFTIAAGLVRQQGPAAGLSAGTFLAFLVAYGTFIGAIGSLSNTVTDVMAIAILRERARPILEAVPEVSDRKTDPGPLAGRLHLDHVVFQYRIDGPIILDNVSVRADPGQFVALVGPSGSGKSTLFRLLLGFESPQSGTVFFDGQDLAGLDVFAVRRQLGVVLQNGRINAGSMFENIVCGTQRTLNDAWEAARATGFADEIQAMPMGMHTVISEGGTNLSGGQRQRLLLARALVHKPRVLLLDEATSALDNQTQAVVSESLARLEVTRVVIAHRLSTIRQASRIYVIEAGRVVQQGGFEELAGQPGLFSRLMARQMV